MLLSNIMLAMLVLSPFLAYVGCMCAITSHHCSTIYFLGGIEHCHAEVQT